MPSRVVSHRREFDRQFNAEFKRRLEVCAILVHSAAVKLISVEGAGRVVKGALAPAARGQGRGKLVYGAYPSKPGDPPHKQTGQLRNSVHWVVGETEQGNMGARVGSDLKTPPYQIYLELGTGKMAARPWLLRSILACADQIRNIFSYPFEFKNAA